MISGNDATFLIIQWTVKCLGLSAFRRPSATISVNAGGDIISLERHGGWRPDAADGSYMCIDFKNGCTNIHDDSRSGRRRLVPEDLMLKIIDKVRENR